MKYRSKYGHLAGVQTFIALIAVLSLAALPTPALADTTTLNPSADVAANISSVFPSSYAHWQACASNDDDTSYAYTTSGSYQNDRYALPDLALTGTINSVTINIMARATASPTRAGARTLIRTNGTNYLGTDIILTTGYATYSTAYATNPNTGLAWTWTEINNLQAGVSLRRSGSGIASRATYVWIVVDYCIPPDCTITAPSSVYRNSTGNTASVPEAGGGATYAWTIINGTITDGQGTRSIAWSAGTVSPVTIGVTVTVGACECTNSIQIPVITPPALSVDISGNLTFCEGGSTTLTANAAGGAPPYAYDWTDSTAPGTYTGNEYTATGAGTVAVTVTDSAMCSTTIVSDNNTMVTQGNVPGATYPHNAALAWVHPSWWGGLTGYNFGYPGNTAQWIWESYYVVHPVDGDRVFFERTFNIPVTPTSATVHITSDNGYDVYMNGLFIGSAQVRPCWLTDNLTDTCVDSEGWQSVETYPVTLQKGQNILEIRAANELMESGSATPESNPGGVVYDLVYQSICAASDSVEVSVNPKPVAFASSNSPIEAGATILLGGGPDSMSGYEWSGPNGFSSFEQSPSIPNATIDMTGDYILTVTNSFSCQDDTTVNVTVNPVSIPSVTALEIFQDPLCTQIATAMTPQSTYYARVSVSLSNNLEHLQTVQVTLFYNPTGADSMVAPTVANTQTCTILSCAVGATPVWSVSAGIPTSWTVETGECHQSPLDLPTGDWIFAFKPGKVAQENTGVADWDVQGKAIRSPSQTGELYRRDKDMDWYGEITVNPPLLVDWGEIPLGLEFEDAPNPKTVSINYISNGDYFEDIESSATWQSPPLPAPATDTVTLDEIGNNPPAAGMFSLKADNTAVYADAIVVRSTQYGHINAGGTLTGETGVTVDTNSLWLALGPEDISPLTYSGTIYYQIADR